VEETLVDWLTDLERGGGRGARRMEDLGIRKKATATGRDFYYRGRKDDPLFCCSDTVKES